MIVQKGWVVWLTGLPASGKSTIARALKERLSFSENELVMLDSDELREQIANESYDQDSRDAFYRQVVEIAHSESLAGRSVIIAAVGHRTAYRQYARDTITDFAEIWIECPIDEARARDKERHGGRDGLYIGADKGKIINLPGAQVEYERPSSPEVVIDTLRLTPGEAVDEILRSVRFLTDEPISERRSENYHG